MNRLLLVFFTLIATFGLASVADQVRSHSAASSAVKPVVKGRAVEAAVKVVARQRPHNDRPRAAAPATVGPTATTKASNTVKAVTPIVPVSTRSKPTTTTTGTTTATTAAVTTPPPCSLAAGGTCSYPDIPSVGGTYCCLASTCTVGSPYPTCV